MQRAILLATSWLYSGAGDDYNAIGHQPLNAEGDYLEKHDSCITGEEWSRVQFMSFGKGSITGWIRRESVKLVNVETHHESGMRVSSDPAAITVLDTPAQQKKHS